MTEQHLPIRVAAERSALADVPTLPEEIPSPVRSPEMPRGVVNESDSAEDEAFPPALLLVAQEVLRNADSVQKLVQVFGEQSAKARKQEMMKTLAVAGMFFAFMTIIVASSGWLVFTGNLDGNAFSFLIAVVVGSMITFVGSAVFTQMK